MKIHNIKLTKKQYSFISEIQGEILFGGSAGGGKSYAQVVDSLFYAIKYQCSKQIIFRRTLVELEKSILRTCLEVFPSSIYSYSNQQHPFKLFNGSVIDLGYIGHNQDLVKYQSAEYDVIRFDELTHFTEEMYTYMFSRLRGANNFPKAMKSTTNPGGVGHDFVKSRFIDVGEWGKGVKTKNGYRIFIPSSVFDNKFLMEKDPLYVERLENLQEQEKQALLYGNWDIFEGRFFPEFSRTTHVITPFAIRENLKKYCVFDYGLDMLACYFLAVDNFQNIYCYKEIYESGLIISNCAEKIKAHSQGENIECYIAPFDMWNRNRESGESVASIFKKYGINLCKVGERRDVGWYKLKELLKIQQNEYGEMSSKLKIFSNCTNLIRSMSAIQVDKTKEFDCSNHPHELTHSVDAIRYFASFYKGEVKQKIKSKKKDVLFERGTKLSKI